MSNELKTNYAGFVAFAWHTSNLRLRPRGIIASALSPYVGYELIYSYAAEYLVACCQDECGRKRTVATEKDIR
jgi:hypothetical protein